MNPILHSKILGQGTPLLILHGFLGMLDNWKTLGIAFADEGLEVHLIDQRNHGQSFWSETFNYDAMAGDLVAYTKEHRISEAIVLGHSMGGKTAMQFACDNGALVERLLVADISPKYYPPHHEAILRALRTLPLEAIHSRTEADQLLGKSIPDAGTRLFLLKNLYRAQKGQFAFRCNLEVLNKNSARVGDALDASASYAGPTLFLRGGQSDYVHEKELPEIRKHFPRARLETLPGTGHWLHAEQPEAFFKKAMAFINS